MPKIKSSLFSPDGKLLSPSSERADPSASQRETRDAELAALRGSASKSNMFDESGKLVGNSNDSTTELLNLIEERLGNLKSKAAVTSDPAAKESLEMQIWFLDEQKGAVSGMSPEEQSQMIQMLLQEKANAAEAEAAAVKESTSPATPAQNGTPSPPAATPAPTPTNGGQEAAPAPAATPSSKKSPWKKDVLNQVMVEQKGEEPKEEAAPAPATLAPAPAPATPAPTTTTAETLGKLPNEVAVPEKKETETRPDLSWSTSIMTFDASRKVRSDSFGNLDRYDALLTGAELEEEEDEVLAWSETDPHPLSDWKIVVENEQEGGKRTYHVHKLVLSTGPTKSEHFERKFHSWPKENVTEVTLSRSAANAFPQLLDFMYSREDELNLNTMNALGLRHLGKLYGIRKLVVTVTKFIRDDLYADKSLHYLNAAAEFQDQNVMLNAAQVCASNIQTVDRALLTGLDPLLFSMVVSSKTVLCSSEALSEFVGEFCRKHEAEMNEDLLKVVTHSGKMPIIDEREAVYLLNLSAKHETSGNKSDLEARCIKAASLAWKDTLEPQLKQGPESTGPYDSISPELKVKLLEDALIQAKKDHTIATGEKDTVLESEGGRWEEELAKKDITMAELGVKLKGVDEKYMALKKEMKHFKRLPCDYKFPKNKPAFTYHPEGTKYGRIKPAAIPKLGAEAKESGYLYSDGQRYWPIYYYHE